MAQTGKRIYETGEIEKREREKKMFIIGFVVIQTLTLIFLYPLLVTAKRADEELRALSEKKLKDEKKEEGKK